MKAIFMDHVMMRKVFLKSMDGDMERRILSKE
jgi:hypothetical protein